MWGYVLWGKGPVHVPSDPFAMTGNTHRGKVTLVVELVSEYLMPERVEL